MSSNSKLEREEVSIIYHTYQLYCLPWLFMLSLYKACKAEPNSYSVHSYGVCLPIILGRRLEHLQLAKASVWEQNVCLIVKYLSLIFQV